MKIARDLLGIVGDGTTAPSSSIEGSNKEEAAKEMVKRIKKAIAKKGIKAIEQNVRDYIQEYKLADGSTAYVSCVVCYFPIL